MSKLILAYNAGSGWFDRLSDHAHKLLSPSTYSCDLCMLTHDSVRMYPEWRKELDKWNGEVLYLHKGEFNKLYGTFSNELPLIMVDDNGEMELILNTEQLAAFSDLTELISEFSKALERHENESPG